jgi:hypothetical protein
MTFKKAYCYLFYKLYRFWETVSMPRFWSSWKATLSLMALELWILMSILVYYTVITKEDLMSDKLLVVVIIITGVIFSLIKYFVLDRKDQWKDYVQEFDKWPKRKNNIGTLVAWVVVLLIIGNLVFSFYLMSLINWKQYR